MSHNELLNGNLFRVSDAIWREGIFDISVIYIPNIPFDFVALGDLSFTVYFK